jgi:curved DNA-binding protein
MYGMNGPFVDLYETLQLSPNASGETIERVYRLLAKRYHPDNQDTGDAQKFSEVHHAYETLSDTTRRAAYDVTYEQFRGETWRIFDQDAATDDRENDRRLFHGILSLLYAARRRDPRHGGMGSVTLEKTLGCPREHLDFPIWYLKARGWVETLDTGQYAITIEGIDALTSQEVELPSDRLLPESTRETDAPDRPRRRLLQNTA